VQIWLILLIVALVDGLAVTAMLLVRRRAPSGGFFEDTQQASGVLSVAGTVFAVMVGFAFLIAFQSYGNARDSADQEAAATLGLFHAAELFPGRDRDELETGLICYGRAVAEREWALMADDESSTLVSEWASRIQRRFEAVRPVSYREGAAGSSWYAQSDARQQGRLGRLTEADPFVPGAIWVLLILAAAVILTYVLFFADIRERRSSQAMMALAVATALVASLLTIAFLDNAYGTHPGAIGPGSMRDAVSQMRAELARREPQATVPCDPTGAPV
jgi:hypothetical protein